jgi:polyhydroxyalkanoate synthesis regulator phasin
MKPRFLAALGVGLGLAAGGATAVAVGTPGLAGAASPAASSSTDDGTDTTTAPSTSATDESAATDSSTTADPADPEKPAPGEFLQETLQPLIDDGTLTQEQADKVITAIQEARPFGGRGPGFGGHGHHMIVGLDTAATALGVSTEDLRTALADGKSIADVAAEQGVDVQTVIDALVAQASAHLDEAVADGRLTEEEAATRKTEVTEKITEVVNQAGGLRPGRPGAPDAPAPPDITDTPDTTTGD